MKLGATLYIINTVEAVELYIQAFNMKLGYFEKNDDGTYLHAVLRKNESDIFAVSESKDMNALKNMNNVGKPTMSYELDFDTESEVKHAYEILKVDGRILREIGSLPWSPLSADIIDKFGVYWYIFKPGNL